MSRKRILETKMIINKKPKIITTQLYDYKKDIFHVKLGRFQVLPKDIIIQIFSNLDKKYVHPIRLVCKLFNFIINLLFWKQHIPSLDIFQTYIEKIEKGISLPSFSVVLKNKNDFICESKFIKLFTTLSSLKTLKIEYFPNNNIIKHLPNTLEFLSLPDCDIESVLLLPSSVKKLQLTNKKPKTIDELFIRSLPITIRYHFKKCVDVHLTYLPKYIHPIFFALQMNISQLIIEMILNNNYEGEKEILLIASLSYGCTDELIRSMLQLGIIDTNKVFQDVTPLFYAIYFENFNIVRLLVQNGADINARNLDNETYLFKICHSFRSLEIMKLLIQCGANVNLPNYYNETPLHRAILYGNTKIVKLLIQNGADINKITNGGESPLDIAYRTINIEIVELLFQNGADINKMKFYSNDTVPIFYKNGFLQRNIMVEFLKLFIKYGVDVNKIYKDELTPLHSASENGNIEIVKLLVRHGVNVNHVGKYHLKNNNNNIVYKMTPIYIAWWSVYSEMYDFNKVIDYLQDKSDIQLNIDLAKQNNDVDGIRFFQSLLVRPISG